MLGNNNLFNIIITVLLVTQALFDHVVTLESPYHK